MLLGKISIEIDHLDVLNMFKSCWNLILFVFSGMAIGYTADVNKSSWMMIEGSSCGWKLGDKPNRTRHHFPMKLA